MTDEECRAALAGDPHILSKLRDFVDLDEYLRRNLLVAKAEGAIAAARTIRIRANAIARRPRWLLDNLDDLEARIAALPLDLARWRDLVGPSPVTGRIA